MMLNGLELKFHLIKLILPCTKRNERNILNMKERLANAIKLNLRFYVTAFI